MRRESDAAVSSSAARPRTFPHTAPASASRALRREAVGRKNWLFVGSDDGGAVNATFTSLLASAQLCKIEPWAYLRDLFCLLSNWPAHQMLDLAPLNWAQTSGRKDVRALLAANKFRDLTIDAG